MTIEEINGTQKAHAERVVSPLSRPIYISRANVWTTAFRQFKRNSFSESCGTLFVTFASDETDAEEDNADLGGPQRELFCLLVKAIFQASGAFEGKMSMH